MFVCFVVFAAFIAGPQCVFEGETIHFACHPPVPSNNTQSVIWSLGGHALGGIHDQDESLSRFRIIGHRGNELHVSHARRDDTGALRCAINFVDKHGVFQSQTVRHNLTVISPQTSGQEKRTTPAPISSIAAPNPVFQGDSASFFCDTEDSRHVRWFHITSKHNGSSALVQRARQHGSWLDIANMQQGDSGKLVCSAVNADGQSTNKSVNVHVWPGMFISEACLVNTG